MAAFCMPAFPSVQIAKITIQCRAWLHVCVASSCSAGVWSCRTSPNQLLSIYKRLLLRCSDEAPPISYNVLLTKGFIVLIPRRQENIESVAINALGFAGTILVNSKAGLDYIHEQGPLNILEAAGCPWGTKIPS